MRNRSSAQVETDHESLWTYVACPTLVVDQGGIITALSASAQSLLPGAATGSPLDAAVGWLSPAHLGLVQPAAILDHRESATTSGPVGGRRFEAHHALLPGGEVAWSLVE